MGKCREGQVEIILQLTIPEFRRFRDVVPNPLHIGGERSDEVLHGRSAEVIPNNEQQECLLMRPECAR